MFEADFNFCNNPVNANFELNIIPNISNLATKEELSTYVHEQAIASNIWTINHNLNKKPSISVVDSADNVVVGFEKYIDKNTIEIHFNGSFKGKAYLN